MRKFIGIVTCLMLLGAASASQAAPIVYTSESDYLDALSSISYDLIDESFESPTALAPLTTHPGIQWQNALLNTSSGRTGSNSIGSFGPLFVASSVELYGIAGYFKVSNSFLVIILGDSEWVAPIQDPNSFQFIGVVNEVAGSLTGFNLAQFGIYEGWQADDFIIATQSTGNPGSPAPEPATMLLFGTGLVGMAAAKRRRK